MIVLDYRDQRPLYEQIAERFQELIEKGILPKDMQMPSVRSQAMQLSINPNTIQRAYTELERKGYIYPVKGKGSFVADITDLLGVRRSGWEEQMGRLAQEGFAIGVKRERMEAIIRKAEQAAARTEGQGGKDHDQSGRSDETI